MFQFKQFSVDQTGCAMKINTDGVLLGAITEADEPGTILDIGTGTGVIALMLALRHRLAKIDAVELDAAAAETAERNFKASPFAKQLSVYAFGFEKFFDQYPGRTYDVIVSNPPFYIDSLKSPGAKKALAKHADVDFFERLISAVSKHLTAKGCCWLIIPVTLYDTILNIADRHGVFPFTVLQIHSYPHSEPHRAILCLSSMRVLPEISKFSLYESEGVYSDEYKKLLQPYFIVFK